MSKYTFTASKLADRLPDGRTRIYFDETIETETVVTIDEETGKESKKSYKVYLYRVADIPAGEPVDKATITNAIIRAQYSQADVEAIFRHALAGSGAGQKGADELAEFNTFAEAAKARAMEILK